MIRCINLGLTSEYEYLREGGGRRERGRRMTWWEEWESGKVPTGVVSAGRIKGSVGEAMARGEGGAAALSDPLCEEHV